MWHSASLGLNSASLRRSYPGSILQQWPHHPALCDPISLGSDPQLCVSFPTQESHFSPSPAPLAPAIMQCLEGDSKLPPAPADPELAACFLAVPFNISSTWICSAAWMCSLCIACSPIGSVQPSPSLSMVGVGWIRVHSTAWPRHHQVLAQVAFSSFRLPNPCLTTAFALCVGPSRGCAFCLSRAPCPGT